MTLPHVASLSPSPPVTLHRPRTRTIAHAMLTTVLVIGGMASLGYVIARIWPASYEFVAFVQAGSLEKDDLVPRQDVLDRVNGLSYASTVADRLGLSPWAIWRRYSVSAEGRVYVVRARDTDMARGTRLTEVVRDSLLADLKERYDGAIMPHQSYISALEAQIRRAEAEMTQATNAPDRRVPTPNGTIGDRWQALANMREELRNAQVFVARSEPVGAANVVRRRDPDVRGRRVLFTLTGALIGVAVAAAWLLTRAYRLRSPLTLTGA